ncbi:copper chaperone CopZ [Sediminihabitans luteus]|uniref:Copper chaperone CopZ n=1 Tax=Sediminihabitans luteus TaxID=1138585 RepID=A0A2M9D0N8_9CELL|nr:heavy-metal-associated domain-containing protein [Sediminihabitans luteus]PJJ77764.1 copper chaperone CopZ [Sediminihabitans luteus]GIJ00009.1 hypothetical protein Slu03_23860 [Sediminihabitans luteus]
MTTVTTLHVQGITGIDDVARVRAALEGVAGTQEVAVELRAGRPAQVRVHSHGLLDDVALRAAVEDAGLTVAAVDVAPDAEALERATQAAAMQAAHDSAVRAGGA